MSNLETTFEDTVALFPDEDRRREETETLIRLASQPRNSERSAAGPWELVEGAGLVFSAPHEATHIRDGAAKKAEPDTAALAFGLARHVNGGAIATIDGQRGDPNWDTGSPYVRRLVELAGSSPVIDLHMMRPRGVEMCVGLGPMPLRADGLWEPLITEAVRAGLRVSINWPYGANPRTVTAQLQRLGLRAVQVELSSDCFTHAHPARARAWSAMARASAQLVAGDRPRSADLTPS